MIEIPKRFEQASIYDWNESSPLRQAMDTYLLGFSEFIAEGRAPIFLGNSGAGKSRAAAAILNAVNTASSGRVTTAWFSVSEALNRLLDYRDMKISGGYTSIYSPMLTTDLIVMDDFSTLRDSSRLKEYFWMIFENRYLQNRPTIFTGNFYVDQYDDDEFWRNMALNFSTPLVRRLREVGKNLIVIV